MKTREAFRAEAARLSLRPRVGEIGDVRVEKEPQYLRVIGRVRDAAPGHHQQSEKVGTRFPQGALFMSRVVRA